MDMGYKQFFLVPVVVRYIVVSNLKKGIYNYIFQEVMVWDPRLTAMDNRPRPIIYTSIQKDDVDQQIGDILQGNASNSEFHIFRKIISPKP